MTPIKNYGYYYDYWGRKRYDNAPSFSSWEDNPNTINKPKRSRTDRKLQAAKRRQAKKARRKR